MALRPAEGEVAAIIKSSAKASSSPRFFIPRRYTFLSNDDDDDAPDVEMGPVARFEGSK